MQSGVRSVAVYQIVRRLKWRKASFEVGVARADQFNSYLKAFSEDMPFVFFWCHKREEVDDDPSGLPNGVDSGYEPTVLTAFAEFVVQERYLESNTDLFNQLVARCGKEKALYPTRNKWK